jgi:hypothetical protein
MILIQMIQSVLKADSNETPGLWVVLLNTLLADPSALVVTLYVVPIFPSPGVVIFASF